MTRWRAEYRWFRDEYDKQVRELLPLAPGRAARAWLAAVACVLPVKHRLGPLARVPVPLWLESVGQFWVSDWSQLLVAYEIHGRHRVYDVPELPREAATVLDLGANCGLVSRYLRERYPNARIIAVEADPDACRLARRNLAGTGVAVRHAAVAATGGGTVRLRRFGGASWGGSTQAGGGSGYGPPSQTDGETVTVPTVSLDELIDELGSVAVLKIDIEGAEHDVLAASRRLDRVGLIVGEFHPVPGVSAADFFDRLAGFDVLDGAQLTGQGGFVARRAGA